MSLKEVETLRLLLCLHQKIKDFEKNGQAGEQIPSKDLLEGLLNYCLLSTESVVGAVLSFMGKIVKFVAENA